MADAGTTTKNPPAQPGSTIAPMTTNQTPVRHRPGSDHPATARRPMTHPTVARMNCGRDQRPTVDVAIAPIRPATGTARPVPGRSPPATPGFPRLQSPRSQAAAAGTSRGFSPTDRRLNQATTAVSMTKTTKRRLQARPWVARSQRGSTTKGYPSNANNDPAFDNAYRR